MITHSKNRPRAERRLRLNTMAVIAFTVAAWAAAAPLAAADGDSRSNSSSSPDRAAPSGVSSAPQSSAGYRTVAVACSPAAFFAVMADTPSHEGSSVESIGSVTQKPNWYCLVDQLWLRGQTKVCGFWGCNWHTRASTGRNGRISKWSDSVTQDCRGGTHRYRTQTGISYRTISGHIGIMPTYQYHIETYESDVEPEFTCT